MKWNITSPVDRQTFAPEDVFKAGIAQHHIANTAYPIGHVTTMRPYKILRQQIDSFAPQAWEGIDDLGLYVHVPFCETRCSFCEYTVVDPRENQSAEDSYFDLLLKEFEMYGERLKTKDKKLIGFDIGGGTPTMAKVENIARVIEAAHRHFILPSNEMISIETTPKIAAREPQKIRALKALGIGRISMGVQIIQPSLLKALGRTGSAVDLNFAARDHIREAGFQKFNVDLMYGFARQSLKAWGETLGHAIELQPDYVTLYRMRYKGTRVAAQASTVELAQVNEMSGLAKEMLSAASYEANPGKNTYSKIAGDVGTSDYLRDRVIHGTPYIGYGLGAQSLSHQTLAYNSGAAGKALKLYQQKVEAGQLPIQDLYYLSREAAMGKMISVSFYFGEINLNSFEKKFGVTLEQAFRDEVTFVLREGLMEYSERTLRLTPHGAKNYNGVIALFYAPAVKEHILKLTRGETVKAQRGWRKVWQPEWEQLAVSSYQ